MTSLYREIFKKAWLVTKKYLYLWPLGFFVSFLGNTGEYQALINQTRKIRGQSEAAFSLQQFFTTRLPDFYFSAGRSILLVIFIILILAIIAALVWVIISSIGGLIKGSLNASQNKRDTFVSLLNVGSKKFVPVFGLYLISKVIIYGVLALIITPLMLIAYLQGHYLLNTIIAFLSVIIFVPLVIIVSFVARYASAYVILEGQKMWEAFKNGWRLFVANWLISLEMAAALLIFNLVIALGILLVGFLLFSPFFFIGIVHSFQNPSAILDIVVIPLFLTVIITIIIGSIFAVFQMSSWTLLFVRLTEGKKAYSKITRLFVRLAEKFKRT